MDCWVSWVTLFREDGKGWKAAVVFPGSPVSPAIEKPLEVIQKVAEAKAVLEEAHLTRNLDEEVNNIDYFGWGLG